MLHFRWDRAQLTHWHPRMAGKRNWYIVRRQLLNAALGCKVRGDPLAQRLFVPETFRLEDKDAIAGRPDAELAIDRSEPDRIMLLSGEIRSSERARYGEMILIKHKIGRASCRGRVCQCVSNTVSYRSLSKQSHITQKT